LHCWFILLCLFLLFVHFHIVVFMFVVVLHLVVCSICCSFVFILSFCTFGLLVIVRSSSHHRLHVYSFSTISYMHSILQIFIQLFASTFCSNFLCSNFLHHLFCVFFHCIWLLLLWKQQESMRWTLTMSL
jgi:hypothetical protein